MKYRIVSGQIAVGRRFFGKEMMKNGSPLRRLLGLEGKWSKKVKGIAIKDDRVVINYSKFDTVYLEDDFQRFIQHMKEEYQDEISGKITVAKLRGMVDFFDVTVEF